jgi:hypothetical protein
MSEGDTNKLDMSTHVMSQIEDNSNWHDVAFKLLLQNILNLVFPHLWSYVTLNSYLLSWHSFNFMASCYVQLPSLLSHLSYTIDLKLNLLQSFIIQSYNNSSNYALLSCVFSPGRSGLTTVECFVISLLIQNISLLWIPSVHPNKCLDTALKQITAASINPSNLAVHYHTLNVISPV